MAKDKMTETESIKKGLRSRKGKKPSGNDAKAIGLSTGSTMLNLACTGDANYGFLTGHYYFMVGDSQSGKTFLSLTCLAEAAANPAFDQYRLIHDDVEHGALMDFERFFGRRVAERVEPPRRDNVGAPVYSQTVEEFYGHVDDALKSGPVIYVLDSQDCLSSEAERRRFNKVKRASRSGDDAGGSYGDTKAKLHSASLRRLMGPLQDTRSILLVLNQTRDSFDMFQKSSYSGGRALVFYASIQLWLSVGGKLERTIKGKKRQLGVRAKVRVKKNRVTGRDRTVMVPIFHSVGIDDLGSMVDFLIDEGIWSLDNGRVSVSGLGPDFVEKYEPLIRRIEDEEMTGDLRELAVKRWDEIEVACEVKRQKKYQ